VSMDEVQPQRKDRHGDEQRGRDLLAMCEPHVSLPPPGR
jgi:hypothetical protein